MSVETVTGFKCSDGRIFGEKKQADAHEVRLNVEKWVSDFLEGADDAIVDLSVVVNVIVRHRDELRAAMNCTYLRVTSEVLDAPEATHE